MGLFVYTQKGSIISMVDLPTTEIIEPFYHNIVSIETAIVGQQKSTEIVLFCFISLVQNEGEQ